MELVEPAQIDENQLPSNLELFVEDETTLTIEVKNDRVKPKPVFKWFLDRKPIGKYYLARVIYVHIFFQVFDILQDLYH